MRIDSIPAAAAAASASPARTPEVTNQDAEAPSTSVRELGQGIKVTLSERAQARASASKADQAVEESNLPDTIKSLLKRIRELKAQIAEQQAQLSELQRAGADPEQIKAAQQQLSSLNSALTTAYASLAQAMDGDSLSDEQKQQAMSLSMA